MRLLPFVSHTALATALAFLGIAACSDLKDSAPDGASDGATGDGGPTGTDDGSTVGEGGGGGDGGKDGTAPGTGDPRYPQGPVPPDSPPTSNFMITDGADGPLVTDLVTGVVWQDKVPQGTRTALALAKAYCEDLAYDGITDWRLPTRLEALSIMDIKTKFGESNITAPAFSDVANVSCFWTSSVATGGSTFAWEMQGAGLRTTTTDTNCAARCVHGLAIPETPAPVKYELAEPGVVHDPVTGLYWERTPPSTEVTPAEQALRCTQLMIHGKTSRLPTVKELASITDELLDPAFDGAFGALDTQFFTSNPSWSVRFDDGSVFQGPTEGFMHHARCVVGP